MWERKQLAVEVLLIEALRSTTGATASPGLLRGLADARLARSIRQMHESPSRPWTVEQLAEQALLSRRQHGVQPPRRPTTGQICADPLSSARRDVPGLVFSLTHSHTARAAAGSR